MLDRPELAFFNKLSGILHIELTEPAQQAAPHVLNLVASPGARIKALRFDVEVFEDGELRPLTDDELASVAFAAPRIELFNVDAGERVPHEAPNGEHFTVRDLIRAVELTERSTRESAEWLGGVDVHHIFFEGIALEEDGTWAICWGS
jgi:hypothetical protein